MKQQNKKNFWIFLGTPDERSIFGSIESCLKQTGQKISADPLSFVIRATVNGHNYYVKQYHHRGKGVRRFIGRSRAKGEWSNLLYFSSLGIPTPRIVAYGQQKINERKLEVLVTAEVEESKDLATLAQQQPEQFRNRAWCYTTMTQIADYTRRLHDQGFVHWDLKWRNILIQEDTVPKVYFFDCPLGRRWYAWLKYRGAIKDLGCLDLIGQNVLTRTQRLRFYLLYRQINRLDVSGKHQISKIRSFMESKAKRKAARR